MHYGHVTIGCQLSLDSLYFCLYFGLCHQCVSLVHIVYGGHYLTLAALGGLGRLNSGLWRDQTVGANGLGLRLYQVLYRLLYGCGVGLSCERC